MRARCILTIASGLLLAQCASRTPEIKPTYTSSPVPYQSYTCAQLAQEVAALTDKSAELSAARQQNRIKWSVPFLGGDAQATNSRLTEVDGQLAAIEQVRNQKSCR
jgi:alkanesulfonate monooxygenase SsuD/methylene tetrahydromethanopterin reductase-like flavin-dependent oxidoreductase (luciferase family)